MIIGDFTTLSQNVYVCNGSHDLSKKSLPLIISEISIGSNVFIGANAFILLGVDIRDSAAGAVRTKDVDANMIVAGNPAKFLNGAK